MELVHSKTFGHSPVLLNSFMNIVSPVSGIWVDCTFGAGGYSTALLKAGASKVIAIDRDPDTALQARVIKKKFGKKFFIKMGKFSDLNRFLAEESVQTANGFVFDVGVSSMQLDQASRGFSFQNDGPLDMRMSKEGISAFDLLNGASEKDLANIIFFYGEEASAKVIAKAIVKERAHKPIKTTQELKNLILRVSARRFKNPKKLSGVISRTFQAFRIAVNNELKELQLGLNAAEKNLSVGGFLTVISFHSLEDRLVKNFIRERSNINVEGNRFLPQVPAVDPTFESITKKVIKPSAEEIGKNSRSKAAKMRICRKISDKPQIKEESLQRFPQISFQLGDTNCDT